MQKIFKEVNTLDKKCYEEFYLSEDILMEQAANALAKEVKKHAKNKKKILFLCGHGNNGADGITCARILSQDYDVSIFPLYEINSEMGKLQLKRAKALHVKIENELVDAAIYVDCIFGSGLKRSLDTKIQTLIREINQADGYKIACDIPTGIDSEGKVESECFEADVTITMGALKESLFSDEAKDFVGQIKVANLGISRENYEAKSKSYILEKSDMKLPLREKKSAHKGTYGHVGVVSGDKQGASILCATAAFNFGAGLVSVICKEKSNLPVFLMSSDKIPQNCNTIVVGMGLGAKYDKQELYSILFDEKYALVIDADLFYDKIILELLEKKDNIVLTPHPKEFVSILKLAGIADLGVSELQKDRFKWARAFSKKYPKVVLLLKGANTIITQNDILYVNTLGSQKLAKGGSGDVLSGMIGSLVAQKYSPLEAAQSASLAHALVAEKSKYSNYGLNPMDLCEGIKWL